MSDLIERMARTIRDARALPGTRPVARLSDVDRRAATAALVVALDEIGEECARVALSIGEQYGEDETGWFECSETVAQSIRTRIAEMRDHLHPPQPA